MSHLLFLLFETLFLMLLEGKLFVTKQDKASIVTLFWINSIFQINLGLKISHQKLKNVTPRGRGGGRKSAKKCHVLFEWPLICLTVRKKCYFFNGVGEKSGFFLCRNCLFGLPTKSCTQSNSNDM